VLLTCFINSTRKNEMNTQWTDYVAIGYVILHVLLYKLPKGFVLRCVIGRPHSICHMYFFACNCQTDIGRFLWSVLQTAYLHRCTGPPGRLVDFCNTVQDNPTSVCSTLRVFQAEMDKFINNTMNVVRNIELLSRNHCFSAKEISITDSMCVCVCSLSY
jgi:hypothetical protein